MGRGKPMGGRLATSIPTAPAATPTWPLVLRIRRRLRSAYTTTALPYYGYMHPPWGATTHRSVGAIALTVAGWRSVLGRPYYKTTYVEGAKQYEVVAPPAGASLPAGTALPADRAAITIAGVTYYLYGNTFYKQISANGKESFVVVVKPTGIVAVKALPEDFEPMQAGSLMYFRSKNRYYMNYLDPNGEELFVVVDAPAGAVPAVAGAPAGQAAPATTTAAAPAAAQAPAPKPKMVSLTAQPGTPVTVRVAAEVNSGTAKAGQRFQGNLDRPCRWARARAARLPVYGRFGA